MPTRHAAPDVPARDDDACSSTCPGCPECSLEHEEYAPRPAAIGAALWILRCYACDNDARGTRDRRHDAERAVVQACVRHRDQEAA